VANTGVIAAPDVVDQQVETATLAPDPVEHRTHLIVVTMVAAHGDAFAAETIDLCRRLPDGAGLGKARFLRRLSGGI
jgi:hypothetical protein